MNFCELVLDWLCFAKVMQSEIFLLVGSIHPGQSWQRPSEVPAAAPQEGSMPKPGGAPPSFCLHKDTTHSKQPSLNALASKLSESTSPD